MRGLAPKNGVGHNAGGASPDSNGRICGVVCIVMVSGTDQCLLFRVAEFEVEGP